MFRELEYKVADMSEVLEPQATERGVVGGARGFRRQQEEFFDEHPPLYPWPDILRKKGLRLVCKPREALWSNALEDLEIPPGEKLLDIGCGTAIWLDRLTEQYAIEGYGVDVSSQSLLASKASSLGRHALACAEGGHLPFPSGTFGVVLSLDVLEHIPDQMGAVGEMARVLKPGGKLLLWSLNSRQRMTWNWCLSKLGVDIFDRVAHEPSLLPDVPVVEDRLRAAGMNVGRPVLFDSFFALAVDEAIMLVASACERMGLFNEGAWFGELIGQAFLRVVDLVSRASLKPLMWLDWPWVRSGNSNGFLLVAHKAARIAEA